DRLTARSRTKSAGPLAPAASQMKSILRNTRTVFQGASSLHYSSRASWHVLTLQPEQLIYVHPARYICGFLKAFRKSRSAPFTFHLRVGVSVGAKSALKRSYGGTLGPHACRRRRRKHWPRSLRCTHLSRAPGDLVQRRSRGAFTSVTTSVQPHFARRYVARNRRLQRV